MSLYMVHGLLDQAVGGQEEKVRGEVVRGGGRVEGQEGVSGGGC